MSCVRALRCNSDTCVVRWGVISGRIAARVHLSQLPRQANTPGADDAFAQRLLNSPSLLIVEAAEQFGEFVCSFQ